MYVPQNPRSLGMYGCPGCATVIRTVASPSSNAVSLDYCHLSLFVERFPSAQLTRNLPSDTVTGVRSA